MPLIKWTSRSPATPVPYSFQQRQRAKIRGSNARLGTVPCHVSQSRFCGERSVGGGYSHAPVGSLRPSESLDQHQIAEHALRDQFPGFGADHRTHALRADLDDASGFLRGRHHLHAFRGAVRHGLFDVNIFARAERVHDDLLVPMVGNGGDDAVDVFVLEQFVIAAGDGKVGAGQSLGPGYGGHHKDRRLPRIPTPGSLHCIGEQSRSLHANPNHAEAHPIAWRHGLRQSPHRIGIQDDGLQPMAPAAAALSPMNLRRERKFRFMRPPGHSNIANPAVISIVSSSDYFFNILTATSLKKTMSSSL